MKFGLDNIIMKLMSLSWLTTSNTAKYVTKLWDKTNQKRYEIYLDNTIAEIVEPYVPKTVVPSEPIDSDTSEVWETYRQAHRQREVEDGVYALASTIFTNQRDYFVSQYAARASKFNERQLATTLLKIVKCVITTYLSLKNIIGVQPMQGPVGLVYWLRFLESKTDPITGSTTLSLRVLGDAVEARSRRLQASCSVSAAQDLMAVHGLDIEGEIAMALGSEIGHEVISEVLSDLATLATTKQQIDFTSLGSNFQDRADAMVIQIVAACNQIARDTRRGPGNFVVTSPSIISILQCRNGSTFAASTKKKAKGYDNIVHAGTLNGTIDVYCTIGLNHPGASMGNDTVLIGYKGVGETDTGYIYSPYIPVISCGPVINPVTFEPVVSLLTRYGKVVDDGSVGKVSKSGDYYAVLDISNMSF